MASRRTSTRISTSTARSRLDRSFLEASRRMGIPCADFDRSVRYVGDFFGETGEGEPIGTLGGPALIKLLTRLPEGHRAGCHPSLDAELDSVYRSERTVEVARSATLRSERPWSADE